MKKYVLYIFLSLLVLVTVSGCYYYADENFSVETAPSSPPISPAISEETAVSEATADPDIIYEERTRYFYENGTTRAEILKVPAMFADPKNMFAPGTEVQAGGFKYKVNNSKVTQDKSVLNDFTWDSELDNDLFEGSFIPESSQYYILIDMTIRNLSDSEVKVYLNNTLRFFGIKENLVIYDDLGYWNEAGEYDFFNGEPRNLTNNQNTGKSLFLYTFKPHETLNTSFLFCTNDRTLDYDLYLSTDGTMNSSTKFLKFYSKEDRP